MCSWHSSTVRAALRGAGGAVCGADRRGRHPRGEAAHGRCGVHVLLCRGRTGHRWCTGGVPVAGGPPSGRLLAPSFVNLPPGTITGIPRLRTPSGRCTRSAVGVCRDCEPMRRSTAMSDHSLLGPTTKSGTRRRRARGSRGAPPAPMRCMACSVSLLAGIGSLGGGRAEPAVGGVTPRLRIRPFRQTNLHRLRQPSGSRVCRDIHG